LMGVLALYGLNVLYAILLLIVGWWLSARVQRFLERLFGRMSQIDPLVAGFLSNLVRYFILAVVIIAVLQLFGIQTTSLIAVLGAASLAIGLAMQRTLTNVAAGIMLLIFRPIRIGDYIDIDTAAGTVKLVSLFTTELTAFDGVQKIVPNAQVWGSVITNYSANPTRWIQIDVTLDYRTDIGKAISVLRAVIDGDTRTLRQPEPAVVVTGLGAGSIDLQMRVWTKASDYWALRFDLIRKAKEALDASDISIHFPQVALVRKLTEAERG